MLVFLILPSFTAQEGAEDGVTVLLLGNKTDCAAERQVPTLEGERLAQVGAWPCCSVLPSWGPIPQH